MRTMAFLVFSTLAISASAGDSVIRLSEPVESTDRYEVFGSEMADKSEGISLSTLVANEGDYADKAVRVTTRIAQVCQKKGCFFMAQDGDAMARVSFADYSFFIPTDASGKEVTLVGTFSKAPLSDERAAHFAQDLGADGSEVERDAFEYSIVASAVMIPR